MGPLAASSIKAPQLIDKSTSVFYTFSPHCFVINNDIFGCMTLFVIPNDNYGGPSQIVTRYMPLEFSNSAC